MLNWFIKPQEIFLETSYELSYYYNNRAIIQTFLTIKY